MGPFDPPITAVREVVARALAEDLTPLGDISAALLPRTSTAEAENLTTAPLGPVASTVMLLGRVRIGPPGSSTLTKKLPSVLFWKLSVATQVTRLAPSGKVEPEAGVQLTATL